MNEPAHIEQNKPARKYVKHRRGINRTLTEEEVKQRKKEQQKQNNRKYYIKHLQRIRSNNLEKYHMMKGETEKGKKKSVGRPKKY